MLGNYVVLDKLGQGGMGLVLKTEHRRMKRLVALKVLSPKVMLKVELLPGKVQVVQGDTPLGTRPLPAIAPFKAQQARAYQEAWAKHLGVPVEYTNTLGMKFILIPPGEFTMDSTPAEIEEALKVAGDDKHWPECIKSEAPQHKVILTQPVYLGIHEVTQAQYEKVMGRNPSHFAATGPGKDAVVGLDTSTYPVEMVSWNDAAEFCAKLSEKEKLKSFYFRAGETVTMLDGTGYRSRIDKATEMGVENRLCASVKMGAYYLKAGILPVPDMVITTNSPCDAVDMLGQMMDNYKPWASVPKFRLDAPHGQAEEDFAYFGGQLKEMALAIEKVTGRKLAMERFLEV
ncbi:MAG: SUMF1/EgtB/PvdO family nonheme iron enzyme, partial [Planctomycetota bacterium]|nr:SUMF1/EgtB/PvdO family nonheme iron enzyme [Planctomycetota bacterium]